MTGSRSNFTLSDLAQALGDLALAG